MNKPRGRPFQAGNTLGQGRPRGSRNKTEAPEQQLMKEYALSLTRKCLSLAMGGNLPAMRLCMAQIAPAPGGAFFRMKLSPIRNAQDVAKAAEKVIQAMSRGAITAAQCATVMDTLMKRLGIYKAVDVVERIEKLEEGMAARGEYGAG